MKQQQFTTATYQEQFNLAFAMDEILSPHSV